MDGLYASSCPYSPPLDNAIAVVAGYARAQQQQQGRVSVVAVCSTFVRSEKRKSNNTRASLYSRGADRNQDRGKINGDERSSSIIIAITYIQHQSLSLLQHLSR